MHPKLFPWKKKALLTSNKKRKSLDMLHVLIFQRYLKYKDVVDSPVCPLHVGIARFNKGNYKQILKRNKNGDIFKDFIGNNVAKV